jgi:hypothetical protein
LDLLRTRVKHLLSNLLHCDRNCYIEGKDGHLSFLTTANVQSIFAKTISYSYFSNGLELCAIAPASSFDVARYLFITEVKRLYLLYLYSNNMIVKADLNATIYYFDLNETNYIYGLIIR